MLLGDWGLRVGDYIVIFKVKRGKGKQNEKIKK